MLDFTADHITDFIVGTLTSLAAAGLIYLQARFLSGSADQTSPITPSFPRVEAKASRGALFPKPHARTLFLCLLFGFAMGWVNRPSGPEGNDSQALRDEAQTILDDAHDKVEEIIREAHDKAEEIIREAHDKVEEIIREAHDRASDLMSSAATEESSLRLTEQAETAVRIVLLAEEEARRLMETAHHQAKTRQEDARYQAKTIQEDARHQAKTIQEDARYQAKTMQEDAWQRTQRLLQEADLRLSDPSPPTLGEWLRDQAIRLITWPLRVVTLFALVSLTLRAQTSTYISVPSARAALYFSIPLAIFDVIADVSGMAFFVPMFIAAIVYAGMHEKLSSGQLLLAAFSLLYQRFGIVLGLVALQFVIISALAAVGSSIGLVFVVVAKAMGWAYMIQLGGWLTTLLGISIGISIGQELGYAFAAVSFVSVLSGQRT